MSATLSPPPVTASRPTDRDAMTATLIVAFSADPIMRWLFPDTLHYLLHFPELITVLGGDAFASDTADRLPDDSAAALWIRPGVETDVEALGDLTDRSIPAERQGEVFAFAEEVTGHHPTFPHWYLPLIGVDPRCQGQGYGSLLLEHGTARADQDGLPSYLEASSPRNRALYERHGFEVVAEVQTATSPPLWPMVRPAA